MKQKEVKDLSDDQIVEAILDLRKKRLNLRFQQVSGQLEKTHDFRQLRRGIARLLTEQGARARAKAKGGTANA